jgi:hypothetical protein
MQLLAGMKQILNGGITGPDATWPKSFHATLRRSTYIRINA